MLLCYLQSSINDLVENGIEQVADFSVELYGIHRMLTTTCWLFSILPFTHFASAREEEMFMAKSTKVVNRTVLYVRNFCSFAHTPKIRFRYAEEKAKKAGQLPNSSKFVLYVL
jgi:hypothetical protein